MSQTQLPPNTYTFCAKEGSVCPVPSDEPTLIAYKTVDNTGNIYFRGVTGPVDCDSSVFGDPLIGTPKECLKFTYPSSINTLQYDPITGLPVATSGFQVCADEGTICDPAKLNPAVGNTPVDVVFGANDHFNYARISGSIDCTTPIFGETAPEHKGQRVCLWRPAAPIPSAPAPAPIPPPPSSISPSPITPSPITPPKPFHTKSKTGLIITIVIGLVSLVIIIIIIIILFLKHNRN